MGAKLDSERWYAQVLKPVETSHEDKFAKSWNPEVQTDRTIPNNKPDNVIRDNKKETCKLMVVAIPGDRNVIKREADKILKHAVLIT
jgi:hypothetical protein